MKMKYVKILMVTVLLISCCVFSRDVVEASAALVKVVKNDEGAWQLFVNGQPYFIKGMTFTPVKIGEDPKIGNMRNWMDYDDDQDGRNDFAFQTWVDKNYNGIQDQDENAVGDFALMKDLGVNTIRLYHVASDNPMLENIYKRDSGTALQFDHPVNKELLRKLYADYGIMVIMGNFLGSWTIGSGAFWSEGTDYENPLHRENIKKSVKAMILDNKDEPYVLMWLLGNENNIADFSHCNARQKPQAYATLIGELVQMIRELDVNHPIAISEGDAGIVEETFLKLYAKYAPGLDIIAYNSYRQPGGFENLWKDTQKIFDRPIFISEFGTQAYNIKNGEDQDFQERYIRLCWEDIVLNSSKSGAGNSIGGVVFDWTDRWYMDNYPSAHDSGKKPWNTPDGIAHDEWWGILSLGNGADSLMRQKRKAWFYLRSAFRQ